MLSKAVDSNKKLPYTIEFERDQTGKIGLSFVDDLRDFIEGLLYRVFDKHANLADCLGSRLRNEKAIPNQVRNYLENRAQSQSI